MMKSWLVLSMLTMMDLIDGSHSIRTPMNGELEGYKGVLVGATNLGLREAWRVAVCVRLKRACARRSFGPRSAALRRREDSLVCLERRFAGESSIWNSVQ